MSETKGQDASGKGPIGRSKSAPVGSMSASAQAAAGANNNNSNNVVGNFSSPLPPPPPNSGTTTPLAGANKKPME